MALVCVVVAAGPAPAQLSENLSAIRTIEAPPPVARQFDSAAVQRGRQMLGAQCGFCHGSNARGGNGGPDLTRSPIVQEDVDGKQLGEFIRVGRPERGMPPMNLPDDQVLDIATFLRAQIYLNANRRFYTIGNILVGDPAEGRRYFEGKGGCVQCHSVTGDLKSIGSRYDPPTLQDRVVMPRAAPPFGQSPAKGQWVNSLSLQAVVAESAGSVTGRLVQLTDFAVTLYFPETGTTRSWTRVDGNPAVTVIDPLQGHLDLLRRWTDADLHDVTAFLAGLK